MRRTTSSHARWGAPTEGSTGTTNVSVQRAERPSPHAPAHPKAAGAKPVVSFRGVGFTYPGGTASVSDLDLDVYPGELVGIVGQNGAGKTTLTEAFERTSHPIGGRSRGGGAQTHAPPPFRPSRATWPRCSKTPTGKSAKPPCSTRWPLVWTYRVSPPPRRAHARKR